MEIKRFNELEWNLVFWWWMSVFASCNCLVLLFCFLGCRDPNDKAHNSSLGNVILCKLGQYLFSMGYVAFVLKKKVKAEFLLIEVIVRCMTLPSLQRCVSNMQLANLDYAASQQRYQLHICFLLRESVRSVSCVSLSVNAWDLAALPVTWSPPLAVSLFLSSVTWSTSRDWPLVVRAVQCNTYPQYSISVSV